MLDRANELLPGRLTGQRLQQIEMTFVSFKFVAALRYPLAIKPAALFQNSGVPGTKASKAAQN